MLKVSGRVTTPPEMEWSGDGGALDITVALDEIDFKIRPDAQGDPKITLTLPRALAFYIWGNLDRGLVADLRQMEQTGIPSNKLREVRDAMGIKDTPDGE